MERESPQGLEEHGVELKVLFGNAELSHSRRAREACAFQGDEVLVQRLVHAANGDALAVPAPDAAFKLVVPRREVVETLRLEEERCLRGAVEEREGGVRGCEQEAAARASLEALEDSGAAGGKIVTEITKATDFWRAEEYHQRYVQKQGRRRGLL